MANNRITHPTKRPGVVLLMGLLFMAAVTASTVGIAIVVNSSLQQSRNIDNFILASLGADSGLERGLAVIYAGRADYQAALATILPCASTGQTCSRDVVPTYSNGVTASVRSTESIDPVKKTTLAENEAINFDLINLVGAATGSPRYIKITGTCTETPNCNNLLEATWSVIDIYNPNAFSNKSFLEESRYETSAVCLDLTNVRTETDNIGGAFSGNLLGFRVRVRALRGPVENVQVTAYSDVTCTTIQPILSRVKLESTGTAETGARQVSSLKNALVLWQLPASSVFNYVVFSEESIIP